MSNAFEITLDAVGKLPPQDVDALGPQIIAIANAYEQSIYDDIREQPFFEKGMRVMCYPSEEYGTVHKWLGFSEFWKMHKYDICLDNGKLKEGVFESDMQRITGAILWVKK